MYILIPHEAGVNSNITSSSGYPCLYLVNKTYYMCDYDNHYLLLHLLIYGITFYLLHYGGSGPNLVKNSMVFYI